MDRESYTFPMAGLFGTMATYMCIGRAKISCKPLTYTLRVTNLLITAWYWLWQEMIVQARCHGFPFGLEAKNLTSENDLQPIHY